MRNHPHVVLLNQEPKAVSAPSVGKMLAGRILCGKRTRVLAKRTSTPVAMIVKSTAIRGIMIAGIQKEVMNNDRTNLLCVWN